MNEPIGLFGSFNPARERMIVSLIVSIASSCPITRFFICSAKCKIFSLSPCNNFATGIPVHFPTTSAISSLSISCFNNLFATEELSFAFSSSASFCFSNSGNLPY